MLLRAFSAGRKPLLLLLFTLSLVLGTLEGLFILIAKSAVTGARWQTWSIPLLVLSAIVTLRTLAQILSARLELRGLFAWLEEQRGRLLRASAEREFPAYRDPWRNALVTALGDGMEDVAQGLGAGFRCVAALAHLLVLLPLLFVFSWKLAVGAMALALPALAVSRLRAGMLAASAKRWSGSKAELSMEVEAFAEGLEAQAGNGGLAGAAARMGREMDRHALRSRSWETAKAVFPPALEWFFFMALAALALAAGATDAGGERSGGGVPGLLPFGALLLLMYRPIREWARHYPLHVMGGQAWDSLRNLQDTLEACPLRAPRPASARGSILLEGVRFAYGSGPPSLRAGGAARAQAPREGASERPVLDGFDLEIDPRELTWIAGRNGAGKSTLLKLLAGIEAPQAGRISVPAVWRGPAIAYLPQRAIPGADWSAWAEAFAAGHPRAWKELDAILGVEAIAAKAGPSLRGLSGGERQRLCLARAFASPAPYLLLDEPTTWLTANDRERILGDLLAFWRGPGSEARGAALVSHEPFLGEFCSRTVRLQPASLGVPG